MSPPSAGRGVSGGVHERTEHVLSPPRDIGLVVHPDLQHNARVRATLRFHTELIHRERPLLSGEGRPAPRAAGRRSS
jgi:hypothetical protein